MIAIKIFCGAGEPQKLNTLIFVYNKHFVCLIFMGCHDPQKYSNTEILHTKILKQFFQTMVYTNERYTQMKNAEMVNVNLLAHSNWNHLLLHFSILKSKAILGYEILSLVHYRAHVLCWPRKVENCVQENGKGIKWWHQTKHLFAKHSSCVHTVISNNSSSTAFIPHKMIVCIWKLSAWTSKLVVMKSYPVKSLNFNLELH